MTQEDMLAMVKEHQKNLRVSLVSETDNDKIKTLFWQPYTTKYTVEVKCPTSRNMKHHTTLCDAFNDWYSR